MLISIITINYNNLEDLKRTMSSVFEQTWNDFEYIIIDGGSTDGSTTYIEEHSNTLSYWVSEPDNGIYHAMNKGIVKAKGDYLLFLNSGDHFYSPTVLQENHNKITNFDLIYFDIELVDANTSKIVSYPEKLKFSDFYYNTLCHQSTFIKRDLFTKLGLYDENLKFVSDWKLFILALFKFNCSYLKVNAIIATYYLDGISSESSNFKIIMDEKERVLNSDFPQLAEDISNLFKYKAIVLNLRKSKKIGLLVKLGLLNKF